MILPVYTYGQPILKKRAEDVKPGLKGLDKLISNMWDTMYNAQGVGLAAPQVGKSLRIFVVDTTHLEDEKNGFEGIKQVFINAEKIDENGDPWVYEEGCLSIPELHGDVERPERLHLRFMDENFESHEEIFDSLNARVIQHEYDHIEGILFTEHLKPIKKRRIQRRLENIRKGNIDVDYPVRFARR